MTNPAHHATRAYADQAGRALEQQAERQATKGQDRYRDGQTRQAIRYWTQASSTYRAAALFWAAHAEHLSSPEMDTESNKAGAHVAELHAQEVARQADEWHRQAIAAKQRDAAHN